MTTEALVPAAGEPAVATGGAGEIVLPQVIVDAGPSAVARFLEFFAGRIVHRYRQLSAVLLDPDVGDDELRARLLSTGSSWR